MTDEDLRKVLKDYNLTFSKRIREDLKEKTDYKEVVEILSILRRLNIPSNIVEKYSNILYTSSENIRSNYKLLKDNGLYNYTPEELIKILICDNEIVKTNFLHISQKYGRDEINKNILVLQVPAQRIKTIEKYSQLLVPEVLLSAIVSNRSESEIYDIVLTCLRANSKVTPTAFRRTPAEVKSLIKISKDNGIKISDGVFTKTPKELEEIVKMFTRMRIPVVEEFLYCPMDKIELLLASYTDNKVDVIDSLHVLNEDNIRRILQICERFNIDVDYKILGMDPNKLLQIIEICNNYNVKVQKTMFNRSLTDIEEIIKYCKNKDIIVRETYFERTKKEIETIHSKCDLSLKRDDLTYKRDLKEIIDIKVFCETTGMKFNSVLFNNNLDGIERIIATCKRRHVDVVPEMFKRTPRELDRIISILKRQPLVLPFIPEACNRTPYEVDRIKEIIVNSKVRMFPEMFLRTPYEVERIIKITKSSPNAKYYQYPLSKLESILEFCNSKGIKISPSMLGRTTGEIEDLIEICQKNNIAITDSLYLRTPEEVNEIIRYCEEKKMTTTGDCFYKNPEQFKEAVEACESLNIPAVGDVFKRTPDEIRIITKIQRRIDKEPVNNSFGTTPDEVEKIISLLLDNDIEIAGIVFRRKAKELKESIDLIKKKYGKEFLLPQIIYHDKDQIEKVFAYCSGRGYLDVIKTSPYILKLTLYEIVDRDAYINSIGGKFVEDGKFNQIFSWSREKYIEERSKEFETQKGI
jgi:hypothetical protein